MEELVDWIKLDTFKLLAIRSVANAMRNSLKNFAVDASALISHTLAQIAVQCLMEYSIYRERLEWMQSIWLPS